jgi:hypothetical protein
MSHRGNRKDYYASYYKRQGFDRRVYLKDIGIVPACFYCGEPADSIDHTYPVSSLTNLLNSGLELPGRMYIVPACRECNSFLGKEIFATLASRKAYIRKRLRKRYKKYLNQPLWTEEEIDELGDSLRGLVNYATYEAARIRRRLAYKSKR